MYACIHEKTGVAPVSSSHGTFKLARARMRTRYLYWEGLRVFVINDDIVPVLVDKIYIRRGRFCVGCRMVVVILSVVTPQSV
jgi:hypothetical protein